MTTNMETQSVFTGFDERDFDIFQIPGLEQRMNALKEILQPKFKEIGQALVGDVSALVGEPCYVHIAKHARRKVNPPNDSWLSFATSQRGYKMLPHFQIGLWSTHVFVQFAIIYECPRKEEFGQKLLRNWDEVKKQIPADFEWADDHINPKPIMHRDMDDQIEKMATRLMRTKQSELLCGVHIPRELAVSMNGEAWIDSAYNTIRTLLPLYKLI